jgi:preprotein translocase subunit YajC
MSDSLWQLSYRLLAQGDAATAGSPLLEGMFLPLMLTMVVFYFLFMQPDRKKQKELEKQLATLKKNDPVITAGGIYGIVVNISPGSKYITLRIDESNNTRLKVLRSHITSVGPAVEAEEPEKKEAS